MRTHFLLTFGLCSVLSAAAVAQPAPGAQTRVIFFSNTADTLCLVAKKAEPFSDVVLGSCSNPNAAFYNDMARRQIRLVSKPSLCLNDNSGGGAAPFFAMIKECADSSIGEFYTYDAARTRIVSQQQPLSCYQMTGAQRAGARIGKEECKAAKRDQQTFTMSAEGAETWQKMPEARNPMPAAPPVAPAGSPDMGSLTPDRFKDIVYADLEKLQTSGCSFSLYQGKKNIGFMDTQDSGVAAGKARIWFKLDGKMVRVTGDVRKASSQNLGVWSGKLAGQDLRVIEGPVNPRFKNDGGSVGGEGRMEWIGGTLPFRWESGC